MFEPIAVRGDQPFCQSVEHECVIRIRRMAKREGFLRHGGKVTGEGQSTKLETSRAIIAVPARLERCVYAAGCWWPRRSYVHPVLTPCRVNAAFRSRTLFQRGVTADMP